MTGVQTSTHTDGESMLAVTFSEFGGPDVLRVAKLPLPVPGADDIVVRVSAAAINPTDLMMRSGQQASLMRGLSPPYVAGMEFAGHVHSVGERVSDVTVGQTVMGVVNSRRPGGGAHAQFVHVPVTSVAVLQQAVDLVTAATVPMNGLTARASLNALNLRPTNTLLVTGGAGVLGGLLIQLAKRDGLIVVADARESDVEWLRQLGADVIVPRGYGMYVAVREHFPLGVDGVIDTALLGRPVGGLVREGGAAVSLRRTHRISDSRLRQYDVLVTEQMYKTAALRELARLLQDGGLATRVALRLPMTEAAQAHRIAEQGGLRGRVVLTF